MPHNHTITQCSLIVGCIAGIVRCKAMMGNKKNIWQFARQAHKSTALHIAAMDGNLELARTLVEAGASKTRKNARGRTPYEAALEVFGGQRLPGPLEKTLRP